MTAARTNVCQPEALCSPLRAVPLHRPPGGPWLPSPPDPVAVLSALLDRLRSDNARLERSVQELAALIPAGGIAPESRGLQAPSGREGGERKVRG